MEGLVLKVLILEDLVLILEEVVRGTMVELLSVQALTILKHLFRQDNDNDNDEIVINFFHRLALSLGGQAGHHV